MGVLQDLMMRTFIVLFVSLLTLIPQGAFAKENATTGLDSNWVERFFDERAPQYKDVKHCIEYTSYKLGLPIELLVSVMMVENGGTNPKRLNNNGTYDYGVFQINDARLPELDHLNVTKEDLVNNSCLNVFVGGYILKGEITKAGEFWAGVGNYHYGLWGKYPENHYQYIERVFTTWKSLL